MKGLARGMMAMGAKSEPDGDEDEAPASSKPANSGGEDAAFSLAFEAVKEGDEAAFKAAMRSAVRACMRSYGSKTEE